MYFCFQFAVNHASGNETEFSYVPTQPAMVSSSKVTVKYKAISGFLHLVNSHLCCTNFDQCSVVCAYLCIVSGNSPVNW